MAAIGKISINLEAQSAAFTGTIQKAGKDVDTLRSQMEHLKKQGGSNIFEKLREGLGRRSAIGEAGELLRGGGPISGLTGAAESIKSLAEGARHLKEEFESGKLSAGELTEKLISSVPVVGQFWQAGRAIRELFTNEGDDLALAETQAKALDAALKSQKETWDLLRDEAAAYEHKLAEIENRVVQAKGSEAEKKASAEKLEAAKRLEDIEKSRQEQLKKAAEISKPAIDAANKAAHDANETPTHILTGEIDEDEQTRRATIRTQTAMARAKAVQTQRDAEAKINADADKLLAKEQAATTEIQKAEAEKAAQAKAVVINKSDSEIAAKQKANAERDAKAIGDAQANAAAAKLRSQGNDLGAERVALQQHLDDRLAQIKKEAEEELALRKSTDLAGQGEVAVAAAKKAAAALAETQAQIDAAEHEAAKAKIKEREEEAAQLTKESETAADKYIAQLDKIKRLEDSGNLNKQQALAAVDKANKELGQSLASQHHVSENAGAAETRRFDMNVGRVSQGENPLVKMQADAQKVREQMNFYLSQLYQYGMNANRGVNQIVNF